MVLLFRSRDEVDDIENAMFPLFVTPITLAARLHRSEIIELICKEGHSDIHPISGICGYITTKKNGEIFCTCFSEMPVQE